MASPTSSILAQRLSVAFQDNATLITLCQDIASEIQANQIKLHQFIDELRSFITDKDVEMRERGITAVSSVLAELPKDYLNKTELHFLTTFYCDRLKDHHSIIPAVIQGILAIVQMDDLPNDAPTQLLTTMFQHIRCQSQLQPDRHNIYLIFVHLLQKRLNDLKTMGPDLVFGVISSIDGERDPRNLLLIFTMLPHFIKNIPLGHLTEEMFEVIACYFPVDFNPSSAESSTITRDDLADALAPCLCATQEFAEFCVPLVADKLFSSLRVAKIDSLKLMCAGAPIFGVDGIQNHLTELWSVLRKEVMPGGDAEVTNLSLKLVMKLIEVISTDESTRESFVDKILTDTRSSLCDVQLSLYRPAEKVVETVARTNKTSCQQTLKTIVPLCLGQYSTKTSLNDKVILMETLNKFMKISSDFGFTIKSIPELAWTDIPQIYLNELAVASSELKSKTLLGLAIQKECLNAGQRAIFFESIHKNIETGCSEIRSVCHICLVEIAKINTDEVLTFAQEKLQLQNDEITQDALIRRLEALCAIAKIHDLSIEIVPQIVAMVSVADIEICLAALTCLQKLVNAKDVNFDIHHFLYCNCQLMDKLCAANIEGTDRRLPLLLNICQCIVRKLTVEEQQELVNKYASILTESSKRDANFIMGLFIPLRRDTDLKFDEALLHFLYSQAVNSSTESTRLLSCKLLSVLLNKISEEDVFESHFVYLKERIIDVLRNSVDNSVQLATIVLLLWLTKAAVTKGSRNSQDLLDVISDNLKSDGVIGQYTAQEYKILIDKHEDVLTTENFCVVKMLYKQRIFQHLIHQNNNFHNASRQNYLSAVTNLLEDVPVELLFMHLTELVPLLSESLSLDNGHLLLSTLVTLKLLLDTKNIIFSDNVQSFIPKLLTLVTYKLMRVRIAALECLENYCKYPIPLILLYKQDVLDTLGKVVDDHKRLVRKAAVKALTQWYLIGAPGGITEEPHT